MAFPCDVGRVELILWSDSESSEQFSYAETLFEPIQARLNVITEEEIPALKAALRANGAPWTLGEPIGN